MPTPGVTLTRGERISPRTPPTDSGTVFLTGIAAQGPANTPTLVRSIAEFEATFGARDASGLLWDALDVFFREGGARAYVARVTQGGAGATGVPVEADWTAALDSFSRDLGPGQVLAPGRTTAAAHAALVAHAAARNRVAMLDGPNTAVVATHTALAATDRALGAPGPRTSSYWGSWATVAGVAAGTTRAIPWSVIEAGIMARNDAEGNSENVPAAGELGVSRTALALTQAEFSDADRATLHDAGVNIARRLWGGPARAYGYRTLVDEDTDPNFVNLGNARLYMALQARLEAVAERFVFRQIDGQGRVLGEFEGALTGVLLPYQKAGSLYGDTPAEAFSVDVGSALNTPERLAAGELRANVLVRMSPFAEAVLIELVKIATQEDLA